MYHPNQEQAEVKGKNKRYYTGCSKYLHRFDELIMKPLFIYNYERNMQKKSKEFFNLFMNQGTQIEQEYTNDQINTKMLREQGVTMAGFQDQSEKKSDGASAVSYSQSGYLVNQFKQARKKSLRMHSKNNIRDKLAQIEKEKSQGRGDA